MPVVSNFEAKVFVQLNSQMQKLAKYQDSSISLLDTLITNAYIY